MANCCFVASRWDGAGVAWAGKELPKDGMVDRHGAALKALEEALRAMDGKGQKVRHVAACRSPPVWGPPCGGCKTIEIL